MREKAKKLSHAKAQSHRESSSFVLQTFQILSVCEDFGQREFLWLRPGQTGRAGFFAPDRLCVSLFS